jgi:hypothetical protein
LEESRLKTGKNGEGCYGVLEDGGDLNNGGSGGRKWVPWGDGEDKNNKKW